MPTRCSRPTARQAGLIYLLHDKANRHRQKSRLRAKVEFPFRIVKRLWGHATVRYRALAKNTARLHLLFALSNPYQARQTLLAAA